MQFLEELYSNIDKNSEEKFEDTFLVRIATKGTSLNGVIYGRISELFNNSDSGQVVINRLPEVRPFPNGFC